MVLADILFTGFNFSVLVAVFIYGLWYSKKIFLKEITEEKEDHKRLVDSRADLRYQLKCCQENTEKESRTCKDLECKVLYWKQNFAQAQEVAEQRRKLLKDVLADRYEQQKLLREAQRIEARVVPHALAEARLELYEQFQEEGKGVDYVHQIVANLKKVKQ